MASLIGGGILGLSTIANLVVPLPLAANLLLFTLVPIFIGSMRSRKLSPFSEFKTSEQTDVNVIGKDEALRFPLIASAVLLSLYVAIKYISPSLVNLLISLYFLVIGAYCLKHYIYLYLQTYGLAVSSWKISKTVKIPYLVPVAEIIEVTLQDVVGYLLALPVTLAYLYTRNWVLSNVFGIALSIHALENMPLGSFLIGFGLLLGLMAYDVFFVFGTDVMLTVAKNIDAPIKLLFPKIGGGFSMIGLGDIILPGIVVAMTIRYDIFRFHKREKKGFYVYFVSGMIGYAAGIVATLIAMNIMEKEQPALLYLVPTTVLSVIIPAIANGELAQLWLYKEENSE